MMNVESKIISREISPLLWKAGGDGVHGRKLYFGADIGSHNQCREALPISKEVLFVTPMR